MQPNSTVSCHMINPYVEQGSSITFNHSCIVNNSCIVVAFSFSTINDIIQLDQTSLTQIILDFQVLLHLYKMHFNVS